MSWIADTHNNPLYFDVEFLPPQRSALAVLEAEVEELKHFSPAELLERARSRLQSAPNSASVYGREITEADLEQAAARLEKAGDCVMNVLLDFRHYGYDLSGIPELCQAVAQFQKGLSSWQRPDIVNLHLVCSLLLEALPKVEGVDEELPSLSRPELPSTQDLLSGLI